MELELKELGLTLTVGGLAFFGFSQIIRILNGDDEDAEPMRLRSEGGETDFRKWLAYVAVIFALGIFLEDFTKEVSAERDPEANTFFRGVIDTDRNLRLRSMFDVRSTLWQGLKSQYNALVLNDYDDARLIVRPKDIFGGLAALTNLAHPNHAFVMKLTDITATLEKHRKAQPQTDSDNKVASAFEIEATSVAGFKKEVNELYQIAKNRVYKEDTYFHELQEIHGRVDFSRSCVLLSSVLAVMFGLLCATFFLFPWIETIAETPVGRRVVSVTKKVLSFLPLGDQPVVAFTVSVTGLLTVQYWLAPLLRPWPNGILFWLWAFRIGFLLSAFASLMLTWDKRRNFKCTVWEETGHEWHWLSLCWASSWPERATEMSTLAKTYA